MSSKYLNIPNNGAKSWKASVATFTDLPSLCNDVGDVRITEDTNTLYQWNGSTWNPISGVPVPSYTVIQADSGSSPTATIPGETLTIAGGTGIATVGDAGTDTLTINVDEAQINHNNLLNYVADQHVDHSTLNINTGDGLSGGGNLTISRTIAYDINSLSTPTLSLTDVLLLEDSDDSFNPKKTTVQDIIDLIPAGGGGSVQAIWQFDDSTSSGNPGSGNFRFNNSNPASVTQVFISDEDKNGNDFSNILNALPVGTQLYIQNTETATQFVLVSLDSAPTDNGSWVTLDVTVQDSGLIIEDGKESGFIFFTGSAISSLSLGDLTDVDLVTEAPVEVDNLQFDGTNWIPIPGWEYFTPENQLRSGTKEISVGSPAQGAESVFGEGDSYLEDMLVYTEISSVFTNVTSAMSNLASDDTALGGALNDAIYFGVNSSPTRFFYGLKLDIITARSGGTMVAEYWNGAAWTVFNTMSTQSGGEYLSYADELLSVAESQQVRFDPEILDDWTTTDPVSLGTNLYWVRLRNSVAPTTPATLRSSKLHTCRTELNADGYLELFGNARPYNTLDIGIEQFQPAGSSPGNQDVYLSDNLDVGRFENNFQSGAVDRIALSKFLPVDIDTSGKLRLTIAYIASNTNTGDIDYTIRWATSARGASIYRNIGAAPPTAPNERSISGVIAGPGVADVEQTLTFELEIPEATPFRTGAAPGDLLWISIERDGPSGTYTGNTAIVQFKVEYLTCTIGAHQ